MVGNATESTNQDTIFELRPRSDRMIVRCRNQNHGYFRAQISENHNLTPIAKVLTRSRAPAQAPGSASRGWMANLLAHL